MINKESIIILIWHKVPKSWLYWAIQVAWAKAMSEKHGNKHPNEISWEMICNFLENKEGNNE